MGSDLPISVPEVGWLPGGNVGEEVPSPSSRLNKGVTEACGYVPVPRTVWGTYRHLIFVEQMNNSLLLIDDSFSKYSLTFSLLGLWPAKEDCTVERVTQLPSGGNVPYRLGAQDGATLPGFETQLCQSLYFFVPQFPQLYNGDEIVPTSRNYFDNRILGIIVTTQMLMMIMAHIF